MQPIARYELEFLSIRALQSRLGKGSLHCKQFWSHLRPSARRETQRLQAEISRTELDSRYFGIAIQIHFQIQIQTKIHIRIGIKVEIQVQIQTLIRTFPHSDSNSDSYSNSNQNPLLLSCAFFLRVFAMTRIPSGIPSAFVTTHISLIMDISVAIPRIVRILYSRKAFITWFTRAKRSLRSVLLNWSRQASATSANASRA